MAKILKMNHVAIAVEDIENALGFWQDALGIRLDHVEEVPTQKAKVAVARELLVIIWHMLRSGQPYQERTSKHR